MTNLSPAFTASTAVETRAVPAPTPTVAPIPARDQEVWSLANRVQQLHRSAAALQGLVARLGSPAASPVTVLPLADRKVKVQPIAAAPAQAWWPTARLPAQPLQPPPGFECFSSGSEILPALAVNVLGLRGRDLDHAVALIAEEQARSPGFKPVFLTDSPDFSAMVRRGHVVAHLPAADLSPDSPDGIAPEARAFLERKWGFGPPIDLRATRAPALAAPPPGQAAQPVRPAPSAAQPRRKKAAVISWDLGHNPAGRAMVVYDLLAQDHDVELIGPLWSRFGGTVWGPIAGSTRKTRGFPCETLEDFWPAALAFASGAQFDVVVVCKPRLPALVLGALLKQTCGCPLVLDVDDFELSFFPNETALSLAELEAAGPAALAEPYAEAATRACEALIGDADAVTVSNIALRQRYGGTIVRHARDEATFLASNFDRAAERQKMAMSPQDFALVFVGTARAHKGVFDIARTLAEMPDKRFVLHLVGDIPDRRVRNELDRHKGARIVYHPNCPFEDLPSKIVAADAVVLLQDAAHPISKYQIPAKVSDASAFGLPILATDVPPLRDLALQGLITTLAPADLGAVLQDLLAQRERGQNTAARQRVREAFEAELGFRVNRERLGFAMDRAAQAGPGLPSSFQRLIDLTARAYAALRRQRAAAQAPAAPVATPPKRPRAAPSRPPVDVVMFWKQNDTGLFGRRSDMVMKHLLASGRVGRVLQIDAPLEVTQLASSVEAGAASTGRRILSHVIDNQYGLRDTDRHLFRTHLWDRRGRPTVLPQVAGALDDYPAWVAAQMQAAGIRAETALAWVCPVVFDFPAVARHIPFRGIIGDLIDDQRNFAMQPAYRDRVVASYQATLPLFDLAFTNCYPQARAFAGMTRHIEVVPNGTEIVCAPGQTVPMPAALANLPRPLVGYVGNLRDRFDWPLLRDTARLLPHVSFAIMGGGARAEDLEVVSGVPNISFTGVVPYDQVQAHIQALDVALVMHTRDDLTESMNPLKIYNYFAARRQIVSTAVDNIDPGIRPFLRFAATPADFAAAITSALGAAPLQGRSYDKVLASITWDNRIRQILTALDAVPGLMP